MIDFAVSLRQEKVNIRQLSTYYRNEDSREIDTKTIPVSMGQNDRVRQKQNNEKTQ